MNVDLVLDSSSMQTVEPEFNALLDGFKFSPGSKYSEFTRGDKVAAVGLTALIAGGAGAVAMKTGLLAKMWKLIVVVFVAIIGFIKKILRSIGKALGLVKDEEKADSATAGQ